MGFSPYIYYQRDGTSSVSLVGCNMDHRHEQVGNMCYRVGVSTAGTRVWNDNNFEKPGHSWTNASLDLGSYNSYTIIGDGNYPVQPYALDLPLVTGQNKIYSGVSFIAGTTGYATRINVLQGIWMDCESLYPYTVTGTGAERLVYTGMNGFKRTVLIGNTQFGASGGGLTNFTPVAIPKEFDNSMYGYVSVNFQVNNTEESAVTGIQMRVLVNGVQSGVISFVNFPVGLSQLTVPPMRFALGRRDRGTNTHTVALQIINPSGNTRPIYFNPTIDGQVTISVDQNSFTP